MILRKVFEPFRVYLNGLIHMSSDAWECGQAAGEARYLMGSGGRQRTHRVVVAATHELESKVVNAMRELGGPQKWEHLPGRDRTAECGGLLSE